MSLDKYFNSKAVEESQYPLWEASGIFQGPVQPTSKTYAIMMPPPNVTGSLHIGHALNYSLQDVLARIHRMQGFDVLWQPGTDHAGIATQMVVERHLASEGLTRQDLGREAFLERVWAWKKESGDTIVAQQRRLGLTPDWQRARFTMDDGLSKAVRKVFVSLHQEGLIYKDKRLVNWDCQLQTAVSDLEVKSVQSSGTYWYIRYPIVERPGSFITVATSRPETLFGDAAIAVHPEDDRYKALVGLHASIPLEGRNIPIIADSYSDPEKGTGAVKITPAHDFNDFEVGKRHGLTPLSILDQKCCLTDVVPEAYQGLDRFEARDRVVQALNESGFLEKEEGAMLALPRSERTDVILEPLLMDQWFVNAHALAQPALKAVQEGDTRIVPPHWKNTYDHWLENIQPWCISRQLWWGHRIPAYYGPDDFIFVAETQAEALLQAEAHYGRPVSLREETDVLDTWFSSALWPFTTLGWPDQTPELQAYYPTQVLITGTDIVFFWVARMMMMGLKFMGKVPFQDVFLHALVRDASGTKMSKTKGNVLDPLTLIESYGADALRFSLVSLTVPGRDIKFSEVHVENSRHFVTKLWNSARFAEHYGCVYDPDFDVKSVKFALNRWILSEFSQLLQVLEEKCREYRFDDMTRALHHFSWGHFCDWYLELAKPLLSGEDEDAKDETQRTVAYVLVQLCHVLNPFMPFVSEEIWRHFSGKTDFLMAQSWPKVSLNDPKALEEIRWLIVVIEHIRHMRVTLNIAATQPLMLAIEEGDAIAKSVFESYGPVLQRMGRLESVVWGKSSHASFAKAGLKELTSHGLLRIPLGDVLDFEEEKIRLHKRLEACEKEISQAQDKLNRQDFMAKAPEDVVEKIKIRYKEAIESKEKINQLISSLMEECK